MRTDYFMDMEFHRKLFRDSLLNDCYGMAGESIGIIKRINREKAEKIILSDSFDIMRIMFNEHKNPRKALLMISGISEHIKPETVTAMKDKYTELTVEFHRLKG